MSEAEIAKNKLEAAGFIVGSQQRGLLVSIERKSDPNVRVWLDTGNTVRVVGDKSDPHNELLLDILGAIDGPESRERARIAWSGC